MRENEHTKLPPSEGDKVEDLENSREITKNNTLLEIVKVPEDNFKKQYVKSNIFCPEAAMTSHK